MPVETVRSYLMDSASSGPSSASSGVMSGLLREGWSGLSEALTPSTGLSLNVLGTSTPTPLPSQQASTPTTNSADLLELTSRLTRQLKRAEETCRRIELREKNRVEMLKRCLVACCAKESAEVLERALEIAANEEPDVEKESREFQELLVVRSEPSEKLEEELNRIAQLEQQLKEERALRLKAEDDSAIMDARFKTQQEAWDQEREKYISERKSVDEIVKKRLAEEENLSAERIKILEQSHVNTLELETAKLQDRIRTLENKLEKEKKSNHLDERMKSDAVRLALVEKDQEIELLKGRVEELEDQTRPEREFLELAKAQATKERVLRSLENRVKELEIKCENKDAEIADLRNQIQGAVPSENLGPARGEYMRHIILRYMTFESVSQKAALIPVIALLLNFSADEKKQCEASATRDLAREGVIGQLAASLQGSPLQSIFSSHPQALPRAPHRYIPLSTMHEGKPNGE